jgi:LacI family transcriptional regulator
MLAVRRESTQGAGRREPHVLEAVEIIRREACDGLTPTQLAARLPGSRRLLDLRFREAMGHSVMDEILHIRLERVFDLLRRPNMPISAIADFSGFGSLRALDKLFRSRYGCSLRAWRKRNAEP